MAKKIIKQAGKLQGDTVVEFHTRDCVNLFDGFIPNRQNPNTLTLSVKAFSARANMVARNYALGDPVAQEVLVKTEKGFEELIEMCREKNELIDSLIEPFKSVIKTSSYSASPIERSCSKFSVYGMYAVRSCMILDSTVKALMGATHITVMTKFEAGKHKHALNKKYRGILTLAFQYQPKISRDDFDAGNKEAKEKLKYYREKLYIRQDDKREDEELMLHYANYSEKPNMV